MYKKAVLSVMASAAILAGCATTKSVEQKIAAAQNQTDTKIESLAGQVEEIQEHQREQDQKLEELSRSAADALRRAEEAGLLAKGKVVLEETFTEDRIQFASGSADLTDSAKASLGELADKIRALDRAVFIEIQGHSDNRGSASYNEMLGQRRAEAVRRYLSRERQIPLGRMSTISYGETLPVAANNTADGRRQNRRVVVVVLE